MDLKARLEELKEIQRINADEIKIKDKQKSELIRKVVETEGAIKELTKLLQEGDKP